MGVVKKVHRLLGFLDKEWLPDERQIVALEPAWGKAAFFFRTGNRLGHGPDSMRCMSLLEVHRMLKVFRNRFEEGDTFSLLQATSLCAEENLPLPEWLALGFRARLNAFAQPGGVSSLDEVFCSAGLPTNSPRKAAQARQDWQLGGLLWRDTWDLVLADKSITSFDSAIRAVLAAKKYGVARTKAKELVLKLDTNQCEFLGKAETLPRFLEKRRKQMTVKSPNPIVQASTARKRPRGDAPPETS